MPKQKLLLLFDIILPSCFPHDDISDYIKANEESWNHNYSLDERTVKVRIFTIHSDTSETPDINHINYIQPFNSIKINSKDTFKYLKLFLSYYMATGFDEMIDRDSKGTYYLRFVISHNHANDNVILSWGLPDPLF